MIADFFNEKTPLKTFFRKATHTILKGRPEVWVMMRHWQFGGTMVNVGAGGDRIKGFINVDSNPLECPHICCDFRVLPFKDQTVDVVLAKHAWEHVVKGTHPIYDGFLSEMRRVLKVNGILCVILPNREVLGEVAYWKDKTHRWAAFPDKIYQFVSLDTRWAIVQFNELRNYAYPWAFDIVLRKR